MLIIYYVYEGVTFQFGNLYRMPTAHLSYCTLLGKYFLYKT